MSYLSNFNISLDQDKECGVIHVEDVNSYPVTLDGSPRQRTDIGIAIFWSKDNFSTVAYDLSNSNGGWVFSALNNNTYAVKAFVTPVWSAGSWDNNSIIYYEGSFYHNNSGGSTTGTPGISGDWILLENVSDYSIFNTHVGDGALNYGYTQSSEQLDCPLFSILKTDDHQWTISDNSGGVTITSSKLYTGEGVLVESLTFSSGTAVITLTDDFAGYVIIKYSGGSPVMLPIIDLSDARNCMMAMTRYVMCQCSDPCEENCKDRKQIEKRRVELNNMIALLFPILGMTYTDIVRYMGIISELEERKDFITKIGQMISKLNVVSERCGLCNDNESNDC